jgi:ubiquinone/menaquinone biosynthesis C-methylase UbiE
MAKDLFSQQAGAYARFRPGYPPELFEFLSSLAPAHDLAWDCATGNGQAANGLSPFFKKIIATDISKGQLANAFQKDNVEYKLAPAENSGIEENSVDLITVAQAYHWLDWDAFHKEVHRVGKNNAVVAIWMYNRMPIEDKALEKIYERFYFEITGPYWDAARKYVDENYETVKFNFDNAGKKQFSSTVHWDREQFIGYLSSWSAVQKFQEQKGFSPIDLIREDLYKIWPESEVKQLDFPVFLRYGRVLK